MHLHELIVRPVNPSEEQRTLAGFKKWNESTYYQPLPVVGKRRYILCFNPQLFKDQRQARTEALANFRAFVDDLNAELRVAKRCRQRQATKEKFTRHLKRIKLNAFVDVELRLLYVKGETTTIRTYQAAVVVDEQAKRHAQRLDGFWLLVTNHIEKVSNRYKLSAKDAIGPYREKLVIESAFRDIKSFVEVKPVYVWTPDHVKAHYTCCALSHLINRTLTLRLHENPGAVSKEIVAHERLYEELSDCGFRVGTTLCGKGDVRCILKTHSS